MSDTTNLAVEHLFTLTAKTNVSAVIANGPAGTRAIVDASTGTFTGAALKGTVQGPGGDWVTVRANGTMKLDVRLVLTTEDGAAIYMTYLGIGTDGAKHLRTAPLFETGDERYAWLNDVQAIALGGSDGQQVTYEVYRVL